MSEKLREALREIAEYHIPDCPAHFAGDELAWAQRQHAHLRQIARAALAHEWRPTHRHIKRGSTYRVLGEAEVQISKGEPVYGTTERPLREGDLLTVYQAKDGKLWARFPDEFNDGRFEPARTALESQPAGEHDEP